MKKVALAILGQEIEAIRDRLGLTQEDFAREAGVSRATVQNWEHGRTKPNRRMLAKIRGLAVLPASAKKRRINEERIMQAHTALDLIIDRARSDIMEKVLADLDKFAGRFAGEKD